MAISACGGETSGPQPAPQVPPAPAPPAPPAPAEPPARPAPPAGPTAAVEIDPVAGAATPAPANCAPIALDVPAGGTSLSFKSDTRALQLAHLQATARTPGASDPAPLVLTLREASARVVDGWDVCVGQAAPACYANLEMDPGLAQRSFVLDVKPRAGAAVAGSAVTICVFDPLE